MENRPHRSETGNMVEFKPLPTDAAGATKAPFVAPNVTQTLNRAIDKCNHDSNNNDSDGHHDKLNFVGRLSSDDNNNFTSAIGSVNSSSSVKKKFVQFKDDFIDFIEPVGHQSVVEVDRKLVDSGFNHLRTVCRPPESHGHTVQHADLEPGSQRLSEPNYRSSNIHGSAWISTCSDAAVSSHHSFVGATPSSSRSCAFGSNHSELTSHGGSSSFSSPMQPSTGAKKSALAGVSFQPPVCRESGGKRSVHWFRRGLRLHDNPSLKDSIRGADWFRCVYILDADGVTQRSVNKWRFLVQSLEDLDGSLRKIGSRLFILRGQAGDVLSSLQLNWKFNVISFESEPEPWGRERDQAVANCLRAKGVRVISRISHTLYNTPKILEMNNGYPPATYADFLKLISQTVPLPNPEPSVTIEDLAHLRSTQLGCSSPHCCLTNSTNNGALAQRGNSIAAASAAIGEQCVHCDFADGSYGVPKLAELGLDDSHLPPCSWFGGELEALDRLQRYLERKAQKLISKKRNVRLKSGGLLRPIVSANLFPQTDGLGPYLRFGCLSPRLVYIKLTDLFEQIFPHRSPPLTLYSRLLWREFFYTISYNNPRMDSLDGNPFCVPVPWDSNCFALTKWAYGYTGFPFIDSCMRQLATEGWIHSRCRHAVVSFLTRGALFQPWDQGFKIFEELSLDSDWALTAGTFLFLSGSSFFQSFMWVCDPVAIGKKLDPTGKYIRHYNPALSSLPHHLIHEPWHVPGEVLAQYHVQLGTDYPVRIVDHDSMCGINFERLAQSYRCLISFRGFVGSQSEFDEVLEYITDEEHCNTGNVELLE